jgi:glutathione S-transferase
MNQAIGILDSYAYRTLVWDIFVERVRAAAGERAPDEARIAAALPKAETCLRALGDVMGAAPWLAGSALSLADLHAAPMLVYFRMAPEGAAMLDRHLGLRRWWEAMAARPSLAATRSPLEAG